MHDAMPCLGTGSRVHSAYPGADHSECTLPVHKMTAKCCVSLGVQQEHEVPNTTLRDGRQSMAYSSNQNTFKIA